MNILSLFDGMSCGQIALNRFGVHYDNYFASEIDKHAIKTTQHNFPNTIQLGCVTKIKPSDLPKIDFLIGGSPCQGFSFSGKQLNFKDPRSKLFFDFVRLKNELNPKYFFLENVKMKKEYQDIISDFLGVEPIEVNSSLVSAQNRVRLYWTNIEGFKMPYDKGIVIGDIVGKDVTNRLNKQKVLFNIYPKKGQNGNVYALNGKTKTLSAGTGIKGRGIGSSNSPKIEWDNEKGWRRMTVEECCELQNLDRSFFDENLSDTQIYKLLGNGWTVDVIGEFFKLLNPSIERLPLRAGVFYF